MEFTYNDYIKNPMGRKNSVFSQREMFRSLYRQKLDAILARELGKVNYQLFINKDKYVIYFKIPSEVVPKFYYDTVIEFYTNDKLIHMENSLENYNVRFFSNDPSFVFTFAHAFRKNDLNINDLDSKLPKLAIKKEAKEKNPDNQIGYVKSLFFAYLLMRQYGLFDKKKFELYSKSYNKNALLKEVENAEDKIRKRQEEAQRLKKAIKIVKPKEPVRQNNNQVETNSKFNVKKTPSVKSTNSIKKTNTVKKTKRI